MEKIKVNRHKESVMNRSKEDISVHFYNNSLRFHPKVCLVKDLLNIGI